MLLCNLKKTFFDRILGIFEFRKPGIVLRDPETIKQLAVKDFDHFEDHRNIIDDKVFLETLFKLNMHAITAFFSLLG